MEKILELLGAEKLDESSQNEIKEKLQSIIEVKASELSKVNLSEEKENLIKEYEEKFEEYKGDLITTRFNLLKVSSVDDACLDWKMFHPQDQEYTIFFPEKPKESCKDIPIPGSKDSLPYSEVICTPRKSEVKYSISHTVLPRKWLKWSSSLVLKGSLKFITKHEGKLRIIDRRVRTFKNLPSLDYVLASGAQEIVGRLILIDNKLYKIEVMYPFPIRERMESDISKFLDSFTPTVIPFQQPR